MVIIIINKIARTHMHMQRPVQSHSHSCDRKGHWEGLLELKASFAKHQNEVAMGVEENLSEILFEGKAERTFDCLGTVHGGTSTERLKGRSLCRQRDRDHSQGEVERELSHPTNHCRGHQNETEPSRTCDGEFQP